MRGCAIQSRSEAGVPWRTCPQLTVRQIFYRPVGAHNYEKTEAAYEPLGEKIARARRARMIDFSAGLDTRPFTRAQRVLKELKTFWERRLDHLETDLESSPRKRKIK